MNYNSKIVGYNNACICNVPYAEEYSNILFTHYCLFKPD